MRNIVIVVEDEPSPDLLEEHGDRGRRTRCSGFNQGIPLTEAAGGDAGQSVAGSHSDFFRGPHERAAEDQDDLSDAIAETLIHEIGHYFGMSEEEIEDIEEKLLEEKGDGSLFDAALPEDPGPPPRLRKETPIPFFTVLVNDSGSIFLEPGLGRPRVIRAIDPQPAGPLSRNRPGAAVRLTGPACSSA